MSMKIRTDAQLKAAFIRVMHSANSAEEIKKGMVNVILGDIDAVMINSMAYLKDMGMINSQLIVIRRLVKKRL